MATDRLVKGNELHGSFRVPATAVFAIGALIVSVVALAFSVGRHFPIRHATDWKNTRALATDSLPGSGPREEITQGAAIAYDQLEVDRGGAETNSYSATSKSAMRQARRGDRDDD